MAAPTAIPTETPDQPPAIHASPGDHALFARSARKVRERPRPAAKKRGASKGCATGDAAAVPPVAGAFGVREDTVRLWRSDCVGRRLVVHTSPTKRSADVIALLQRLDAPYSPRPGGPVKPVVIVLDDGPIHIGRATRAALAARAHWLSVEWLPKHAPELNDIARVWHDLKAHHLAHLAFVDAEALDSAIHQAVEALNVARIPHPLGDQGIPA